MTDLIVNITPAATIAATVAMQGPQGTVATASDAETLTGTDTTKAVTPAGLTSVKATDAETLAGTLTTKWVTPASLTAKLPYFDVRRYGAVGNNVANDRAAIQAAIDAASAANGGIVWFPTPSVAYRISTALTPKSNVHYRGTSGPYVGWYTLISSTSSLFVQNATVQNVSIADMNLYAEATAGHIWDQAGFHTTFVSVDRCTLVQDATASSIWRTGGGDAIEFFVSQCYCKLPIASTVPGWNMVSNANAINICSWTENRFENSGDYCIHIATASTGYCQDITIANNNFQQCLGGEVRLLSCRSVLLSNNAGYDATTYTKHRVRIGKSATGQFSRSIKCSQIVRRNPGVLGAGICDIYVVSAEAHVIIVEQCNGTIDLNSSVGNVLIQGDSSSPAVSYLNLATDVVVLDYAGSRALAHIVGGDAGAGYVEFLSEQSVNPTAPAANGARLFTKDNGAGKTQLCVIFNTGAVQVLATQP